LRGIDPVGRWAPMGFRVHGVNILRLSLHGASSAVSR
jgi:hypothetical protein